MKVPRFWNCERPVVKYKKFRAGNRVVNGSVKGVIIAVDSGHVYVTWDGRAEIDSVHKSSPFWLCFQVYSTYPGNPL